MSRAPPKEDLRRWIGHRLDPLDGSRPGEGANLRSDFDLTPGGWQGAIDGPLKPASVLVPLVERDHGLSVILTRRADTLRQHTGQDAFPGGRRDPGESAVQAALREAEEEIGLSGDFVSLSGLSTPYRTGTGYLITPVVGFVMPGFTLKPNPHEVAEIFETPFDFLMDPSNLEEHEREMPNGERRRFYAYTHSEQFIWGATAGMLRALYDRLYGAAVG